MNTIYLDNAATTAVSPEVLETMLPYFTEHFGNPSSVHATGRDARKAIENARRQVAAAINAANPQEIYFTAGGSESDNWAIKGAAFQNRKKGNHIITTAIEHHAVLHTCKWLERQGFEVTYLPVDENGFVTAEQVEQAITDRTILITVMAANNEIGTLEPIAEIGKVAKAHKILFHTDAVQAVGAIPLDVQAMNIDMLSMSGHKFHGPKGIGALYIRRGVRIDTLIHGGAQERGQRAGTENLAGIVGMGKAIEIATTDLAAKSAKTAALRDRLIDGILERIPDVRVNGPRERRLPNNCNVSVRYIEGESMLLRLDLAGIAASSGSACTSGSLDPSHVLLAIGLPHEVAHGSLRMTLGSDSTQEEVDKVLEVLPGIVSDLRAMSVLNERTSTVTDEVFYRAQPKA
ncbi:MAG: cysteine desulfurase NifS [Clostridia bacterium]|nr:cysteine desulfurase NifS [Clostridia bacterium]MBR4457964.1 cysteine desulfurase NifS [Clostridia bacterium]